MKDLLTIVFSGMLVILAGLCEVAGRYLVWQW